MLNSLAPPLYKYISLLLIKPIRTNWSSQENPQFSHGDLRKGSWNPIFLSRKWSISWSWNKAIESGIWFAVLTLIGPALTLIGHTNAFEYVCTWFDKKGLKVSSVSMDRYHQRNSRRSVICLIVGHCYKATPIIYCDHFIHKFGNLIKVYDWNFWKNRYHLDLTSGACYFNYLWIGLLPLFLGLFFRGWTCFKPWDYILLILRLCPVTWNSKFHHIILGTVNFYRAWRNTRIIDQHNRVLPKKSSVQKISKLESIRMRAQSMIL